MMNNDDISLLPTSPIAPTFAIAWDIAYADGGIDDLDTLTLTDCIRAVGIALSYEEHPRLTRDNADAVAAALYILAQTANI
jgi:hypothetical protein